MDSTAVASFQETTTVVTGGGSGMGLATASLFAEAGARVVLAGRRESALAEAAARIAGEVTGADVVWSTGDLSTAEGADHLAEVAGPSVRALVCAAGGNLDLARGGAPAGSTAELAERWRATLDANLMSAVLPIATLGPALEDQAASIVLVSSQSAADGRGGAYAAAKSALNGLGRSLALELGERGITVNTVMPGVIADTEFFPEGWSQDDLRQSAREQSLTGHLGTARDVAETAFWLSSSRARHLTGQAIRVDAGATMSL